METFFVNLSGVTGATPADTEGQGSIRDNDTATLSIIDAPAVVEGEDARFTVTLSNPSERVVTGNVTPLPDGTATGGPSCTGQYSPPDFDNSPIAFTFNPGAPLSQPIDVPTCDDFEFEDDETFIARLTSVAGAEVARRDAIGTIQDDDILTNVRP